MSVRVPLDELAGAVAARTLGPYLLCTGPDRKPRARSVVVWVDAAGRLCAEVGTRTAVIVRTNPTVTLLWPAGPGEGDALLVDGEASLGEEGTTVMVTASWAALHAVRR